MNFPNGFDWKWNWRKGQLNLQGVWEAGNPGSLLFLRSSGQCLLLGGNPMGSQAPENGELGFFCRKWFQPCSEQDLEFPCFIFCVKIQWLGLFCLTIQLILEHLFKWNQSTEGGLRVYSQNFHGILEVPSVRIPRCYIPNESASHWTVKKHDTTS